MRMKSSVGSGGHKWPSLPKVDTNIMSPILPRPRTESVCVERCVAGVGVNPDVSVSEIPKASVCKKPKASVSEKPKGQC